MHSSYVAPEFYSLIGFLRFRLHASGLHNLVRYNSKRLGGAMGCGGSKPTGGSYATGTATIKLVERTREIGIAPTKTRYAAFLSHYKMEAAMEARYLQSELEGALNQRCFLDSDDLKDLRLLKEAVELTSAGRTRASERVAVVVHVHAGSGHGVAKDLRDAGSIDALLRSLV